MLSSQILIKVITLHKYSFGLIFFICTNAEYNFLSKSENSLKCILNKKILITLRKIRVKKKKRVNHYNFYLKIRRLDAFHLFQYIALSSSSFSVK